MAVHSKKQFLKAVRSLETGHVHIEMKHPEELTDSWIEKRIQKAGDERLFFIGEALRRGVTIEKIHEWSAIDLMVLTQIKENC